MADKLRPDTCEDIRTLCRKISVAHDLDAEIQEELYGHMEDKLIAYLDGEEALAEEDAFILVRKHFGNPSAVKGLLQDVHAYEADVSLARRLAAAVIVTAGVTVVCVYSASAVMWLWPAARGLSGFQASLAVATSLAVVFSWLLLWHWQRRLNAGHTPWFLTWRPAYFVGSIAALLVLKSLVRVTSLVDSSVPMTLWSPSIMRLIVVLLLASPALQCMAWLWWCDRPPRKARAVSIAAGLWAVWILTSSTVTGIDNAMRAVSSSNLPALHVIGLAIGATLLMTVTYALIAYALYRMTRYAVVGFAHWPEARR